MSQHVLTYEVEQLAAVGDGARVGLKSKSPGGTVTLHGALYVDVETAQAMRLHDTVVVTIDVPDDDEPLDDEPEDAPLSLLSLGGPVPLPHLRLGEVS